MSDYILLYFLKNALKHDGDPLLKGWYLYLKDLQVHLNELECREKVHFFLVSYFKKWNFHIF